MSPYRSSPRRDAILLHKVLLASFDALGLAAAYLLSFTIRNYFFGWRGGVYQPNINHALFLAGLIPLLIFYFRSSFLYRTLALRLSVEHLERLSRAWVAFYLFFLAAIFFLRIQLFWEHRITMFIFFVLGWFFLFLGRFVLAPLCLRAAQNGRLGSNRVLCVTSGAEALRIRDVILQESVSAQEVIGFLHESDATGEAIPSIRRLGTPADLPAILQQESISEVYLRMDPVDWNALAEILRHVSERGIRVRIALDQFGALSERVPMLPEAELGYVFVNTSLFYEFESRIKSLLDRLGAVTLLILLSPLFAIIGLLIRLESPGPVFFRQRRVGLDGREFYVFKFRTMRANTESHHQEAVRRFVEKDHAFLQQEGKRAGFFKLTDAAQVTRLGRFLRKSSIDELPQLINVARGEMSLVGPRPLPVYEVALFKPWQHLRHSMRPGITGFWQVFGRSAVSHEDTILMDLYYIMNWSLSLDLRILIRTVFVILTGKGGL
jgi:undecaprenyl-phosphate galactose phosphotransferase